ncbi:MAG: NAD-binding protein [Caldilineae bacterium]|nr:NAD-binding protein [Caldilineae bacterium]
MSPRARPDFGNPIRRLQLAVLALIGLLVIGTLGFRTLADASLIDALLMTVISISTVGYQEVVPLETTTVKLFSIGLILASVVISAWAVASVAELVFAEYLWTFVGRQRMQGRIDRLSDHIIVCGYGRMGRSVVQELVHEHEPFIVIESNAEREAWLLEAGHAFVGDDATHDDCLRAAGLDRARALIAVTGSDAVNLMIVLGARDLNPKLRIAARADDPDSIQKLYRAGADYVLHHHGTGALHLALSVTDPVVEEVLNQLLPRGGVMDFGQLHVDAGDNLEGRSIADLDLRRYGALVLALRSEEALLLPPPIDRPLSAGDILVVAGSSGALLKMRRQLGEPAPSRAARRR